jgi:hypothetical protein
MGVFTYLFVPETKGVPIEAMEEQLFLKHWFWGNMIASHVVVSDSSEGGQLPPRKERQHTRASEANDAQVHLDVLSAQTA